MAFVKNSRATGINYIYNNAINPFTTGALVLCDNHISVDKHQVSNFENLTESKIGNDTRPDTPQCYFLVQLSNRMLIDIFNERLQLPQS